MRISKTYILAALFIALSCLGNAQVLPKWKNVPQKNESVIGSIDLRTQEYQEALSDNDLYILLLDEAGKKFTNYTNMDIRNTKISISNRIGKDPKYYNNPYDRDKEPFNWGYWNGYYGGDITYITYIMHADVIVAEPNPYEETNKNLNIAFNKALRNVREGSRLAIDQVIVTSNMERSEFKDQLIDMLLDKGYKVVAKEYLEKLYDEIKDQQSGIYNDKTTVKEDNFSAVGYYINVKVTETSLRVQVVNVSTGEYEGNATVNF